MQRKNSQKRFNTAGARIVISSKLPPDFFLSSQNLQKGVHFHLHRSQPHHSTLPAHPRASLTQNFLLVTFKRSPSQYRLDLPLRYSCGDGEKGLAEEEKQKKNNLLPPVHRSIEKQNNFCKEFRQVKLMKIRSKNMKNGGWMGQGERQMLKL